MRVASITRLPNRRFWFAMYRDAVGRQHCVSTKIEHAPSGATPKERAARTSNNRRLAIDLANRLEEAERGNATEAHLRKLLGDISARVNKRRIEFAATKSFLDEWLTRVEKTKSPATYARYSGTVAEFLDCLGAKAQAALTDITPQDIQRFAHQRISEGRNATTVATDLKTLNRPFGIALRQGLILSNPVPQADTPTGEKESRSAFEEDDVRAIAKKAEGEWKTAILIGYFTGQRLGDCVSASLSKFDFEKHLIQIRPQKSRNKKKDLTIPIHPELEAHLLDLPVTDPKGLLCPTLAKAKIGGRSGLSRQFQAIMVKAGIKQVSIGAAGKAGRTFNKFGFHSLRHTYVSMLANAGIPPDVRKLLSGHSDDRSHAVYTHTKIDVLRKAINTIPKVGL